jgi:molecular chaperone DnaK
LAQIFGLDFGTTTTLAAFIQNGRANVIVNSDDDLPHPSVIWYRGTETVVGRLAKDQLTEQQTGIVGDIIRSPKSFLGKDTDIHVGGVARKASDVVGDLINHVKEDAINRDYGLAFERAVVTVPINMNGAARKELREAAYRANLRTHQIVHEPLAALYGYLRRLPDFKKKLAELDRKIILVFDWGGGTLDLTLCRIIGGRIVQIQNRGDDSVGGDRFDEKIVNFTKRKHSEEHALQEWPDEQPNAEATLNARCESAKISLSDQRSRTIFVSNYLQSDGPEKTLEVSITRENLVEETKDIVDAALRNINLILETTGINNNSIALCLATGGTIQMPYVRERLLEKFGPARLPKIENSDQIIAEGAAWLAHDGVGLRLSKPFELLYADDSYSVLIDETVDLPTEGKVLKRNYGMYCVDPRDQFAKFQVARPRWPGQSLSSDEREIFTTISIPVDPNARPLLERLEFSVEIDENLIASVHAVSSIVGGEASAAIHDLEFGLFFPTDGQKPDDDPTLERNKRTHNTSGQIRLRSNVIDNNNAWNLVPGEIIEKYKSNYLDTRNNPPSKQIDEKMYYTPCSVCGRYEYDINLKGCDSCPAISRL